MIASASQLRERYILPDTSVWIDHLRRGNARFYDLLGAGVLRMHDHVHGELLLGTVAPSSEAAKFVGDLPRLPTASHEEVIVLVESGRLRGSGIGWFDAHLAASALIWGASLWTIDKSLARVAERLGIAPTLA